MKKAVLVTGAATGTGLAIAQRFAKEGYHVFITSRDIDRAQEAADAIAEKYGVFAKGIVLREQTEAEVISAFQQIDESGYFVETLVLNAANLGFGADPAKGLDPLTVSIKEIESVFHTNLVWNFMLARQAALRMKEHQKGAIVFISSNTAYRAIPNRTAYCASKGGINSMCKALAVDLGKYGIRCNVVLPGTIKTQRWENMGGKTAISGQLTPIGDISDFEDIANAAFYFGTDLSKNVTGAELVVDGGMMSQLYPQELNTLKAEKLAQMD